MPDLTRYMKKETRYSKIRVLVIEDDPISSSIALIKLRQLGVEKVDVVENGQLGLGYLEDKIPDIIFLDIHMPTMDGLEFLDLNQKRGLCPDISVAMLTSSVRSADRERALRYSNVLEYMEKPLDIEKIESIFLKILIKKKN